jgi:hypothetical protein
MGRGTDEIPGPDPKGGRSGSTSPVARDDLRSLAGALPYSEIFDQWVDVVFDVLKPGRFAFFECLNRQSITGCAALRRRLSSFHERKLPRARGPCP